MQQAPQPTNTAPGSNPAQQTTYYYTKLLNAAKESAKCPICLQFFRSATTIPCGHTYCAECLQSVSFLAPPLPGSHKARIKKVKCPVCNIVSNVPRPTGFAVSYAIQGKPHSTLGWSDCILLIPVSGVVDVIQESELRHSQQAAQQNNTTPVDNPAQPALQVPMPPQQNNITPAGNNQ